MERLTVREARVSGLPGVCCTHFTGSECQILGGCCTEGCPWEDAVWERLAAYEDTGLTPEDVKRVEWIYRPINWTGCDLEKAVEEAEKALGFKLFFWQKAYILFGEFRQMGATTAEILRDLLNVSAPPIDYSGRAETEREKFYRRELREMKRKLDDAGILTRAVFFSTGEKRAYMYEKRQEG